MGWGKGLMRRGAATMLEVLAGACVWLALCCGFYAARLRNGVPPPKTPSDPQGSR